ncbi:MAG: AI-2E family transporter [Candidatus Solibacter sp.]
MVRPVPPAGPTDTNQGFSRERLLLFALVLATLLALYICYLIIQPFVPAITIAVAAAVATMRLQDWLRARFRSRSAAAGVGVALVAGLIVIPLTLLIAYLVRQVIDGIGYLERGGGIAEWRSVVHLPPAVDRILAWAQGNLELQSQLANLGQALAGQAGNLLTGSIGVVSQLVIMLFVLFFLYRDREGALSTLRSLVPLSDGEAARMGHRIRDTILATVNGSLTVAFVQSLLAGTMYGILGVPAAAVWGFATFIVALVPMFGTVLVWGPVALFLALSGSWVKALILVGWGALAVGLVDNLLYPYLVGNQLRMHTIPTFFAILGGIQLFGPAGLILGPVTLALTLGLLEVWTERTETASED